MTEDDAEKCGSTETTTGQPCQNNAESCPWHNTDNPPKNGRDSKLTKQREEEIASALESGKSMTSAARMAGVSRNTVYSWLERGEDQDEGVYADFHDRIRRARGHGEDYYFTLALQLARENEDHRFIASLMKQRYPDSWGETETGVEANTVKLEVSEDVKNSWPTTE